MKFEKIYEDSQLPIIKTEFSAGLDFYSRENVDIKPQNTVVVGLGVRSVFDESEFQDGNNKFFLLELRSSLRMQGLTALGSGIIDMDYLGEWKEVICNLSNNIYTIKKGDRIAQAVMMSHMTGTPNEYKTFDTRKGGFGSTGE